jgi:hypothetical protein
VRARRILTETVAAYRTIVMETEIEKLDTYSETTKTRPANPQAEQGTKGCAYIVEGAHREILLADEVEAFQSR